MRTVDQILNAHCCALFLSFLQQLNISFLLTYDLSPLFVLYTSTSCLLERLLFFIASLFIVLLTGPPYPYLLLPTWPLHRRWQDLTTHHVHLMRKSRASSSESASFTGSDSDFHSLPWEFPSLSSLVKRCLTSITGTRPPLRASGYTYGP